MSNFVFILIISLIGAAGVVVSVFYIRRETRQLRNERSSGDNAALNLIKQDLEVIKSEIKDSREKNIEVLQNQLRESSKIVKDVTIQLEKIHLGHQDILDLKGDLGKLKDILANPKQRGILGEYLLETLLKNVFQPHQYKCQYKFKNGDIVDAVIFIREKIVPIDAKFSLENYNRIIDEKDKLRQEKLEQVFKNDLKNRIEEAAKYIRPQEGTMDFAFMFIPSEGIFYDLLINQVGGLKSNTADLIEYAFREKHVIIVSPTSFYAYLQTVLQGLRALQIEESAKQIRQRVEVLQKHIKSYDDFLKKLGDHLSIAVNTYNSAYREFNKIDKDVVKITGAERAVEPLEIEKPIGE